MLNKEPSNWSDITVNQFIELNELIKQDFITKDEYNVHLLSLITDTDIQTIEELDYELFNHLLNKFSFLKVLPKNLATKSLLIDDEKVYFKDDFYSMTLGEFIDLEFLFSRDYMVNFKTILAILYRRKTIKNSVFELDEFEPYGNWINHRAPLFSLIPVIQVYQIIPKYIKFRTELYERYSGLFDGGNTDEEEPIDPNEGIIGKAERLKENAKEKSIKKWGWDLFIYQLANNEPLKFDEATNLPLVAALNILSMKRELGI